MSELNCVVPDFLGCAARTMDESTRMEAVRRYDVCGRDGWVCDRCRPLWDALQQMEVMKGILDAACPGWDEDRIDVERELRKEWWLNHGHTYPALYGDDGEMQCHACPADFKRMPLGELHGLVFRSRLKGHEGTA